MTVPVVLQARNINALSEYVREHQRAYVQAGAAPVHLSCVPAMSGRMRTACLAGTHARRAPAALSVMFA